MIKVIIKIFDLFINHKFYMGRNRNKRRNYLFAGFFHGGCLPWQTVAEIALVQFVSHFIFIQMVCVINHSAQYKVNDESVPKESKWGIDILKPAETGNF